MSINFTVFIKKTGQVLFGGSASEPSAFETDENGVLIGVSSDSGYVFEGDIYVLPQQPSPAHTFNYTTKQWEDLRTLDDLKAAQWTQIKQARSQAEYAGFTWDGSTFDSDAISQQRINGAVSLALIAKQANQPYSITWTLADNTLRVLSAGDMVSVGLALGTHMQTVFNKGQQIQQQIEAATTKEEIDDIIW